MEFVGIFEVGDFNLVFSELGRHGQGPHEFILGNGASSYIGDGTQ